MSISLPAEPARARSLTDVAPQMAAALSGRSDWFPAATSAIMFVVDGLGARNLSARAGHARFLSRSAGRRDVARSVFPSTTASALTSLLTASPVGAHGIVGFSARVPATNAVANQLRGWDTGSIPAGWQRSRPLSLGGGEWFAVSKSEYAGTGFTRATLEGAPFHGADDLDERVRTAADLAAAHPGSLTYLYAPELDAVGHRRGWESSEWTATLERVDAAARLLAEAADPRTGIVVTADHGMIDVARHRHVLLTENDPLTRGVRMFGGEPRMLHVYADDGRADSVLAAWREAESARSWVLSRDEAIEAGLFGPVDAEVRDRIGDVIVAARAAIAYYDDRSEDKGPQRMIGQHGSLTDEERTVPLIRLGAFADG